MSRILDRRAAILALLTGCFSTKNIAGTGIKPTGHCDSGTVFEVDLNGLGCDNNYGLVFHYKNQTVRLTAAEIMKALTD